MRFGRTFVILLLWASLLTTVSASTDSLPTLANQYRNVLSSGVLAAVQQRFIHFQPSPQLISSGQDVRVSSNRLAQNEPAIAINPTNSQNIVVGANDPSPGFAWLGVYTSFDGGQSWNPGIIPRLGVLAGFDAASDPSVTFDRNGTLYFSGLAFNIIGGTPAEGSVFVSKSTDGGVSFTQTTIVAQGTSRIFYDKPFLTVDMSSGEVFVSWTRFISSRSDIIVSHSINGGGSFSTPVQVSTSSLNQGSLPTIGTGGNLYVVWNDLANNSIVEARSTNHGTSFSSPVTVSSYTPLPSSLLNSSFRTNNNPTATADNTNGNLYVSWADYSRGNSDVMFSRSTNNGTSWSSPVRANDDNTNADQFFPWVTASQGRVDVVFYDRRLDPANHLIDLFSASSSDGGSSFSANLRMSDVSSNPDAVIFSNGQSFIGDYVGAASNGKATYAAWTDTRDVSTSSPEDENIYLDRLVANTPPTIEPIANKTVDERTPLTFQAMASDPDQGESLTLSARDLPSGANFSSTPSTTGNATGTFTWTPNEEQGPGVYSVEIVASDGFSTTGRNVSITVQEVNSPPVLSLPAMETVNERSPLTFEVNVTDPDIPANVMTLSCANCSSIGASFDPATGNFTWVPTEDQGPGTYSIVFKATDNGVPPLSANGKVTVQVDEVNEPPRLLPVSNQTIDELATLTFQASATDPDIPPQILVFSLGPDAPEGASISKDGFFSWTPSEKQGPGNYAFTITVSDGSLFDRKTLTVTVNEVDNPPILTVPGPQMVQAGSLAFFRVESYEPNLDTSGKPINSVSLSISWLPEGASFDPKTGTFLWTPSNNQTGTYSVVFYAVENASGLSDMKTVTITVLPLSQSPSVFTGQLGLFLALTPAGFAVVVSALMLRHWSREKRRTSNKLR